MHPLQSTSQNISIKSIKRTDKSWEPQKMLHIAQTSYHNFSFMKWSLPVKWQIADKGGILFGRVTIYENIR